MKKLLTAIAACAAFSAQAETLSVAATPVPHAEILELVARMGDQLRGKLGPHGTTADTGRITGARPANATALRLYAEGLARLRSYEPLKARDFFTQAIASDPRFALAHSALAETWAVLGYDTRALEAAQRALALAKGLSREEQLLVEGRVHEMEKDWARAVDNYRTLSSLFPDNLDHGLRLASAQSSGGLGRDALATLAELRGRMAPPASGDGRIDLAEAQVRRAAGAAQLFARLARIVLGDGQLTVLLVTLWILVMHFLDFRNVKLALASVIPLTVGLAMMLGLMTAFDLHLNFMNIIILPILLGFGVSHGLYLLHRFLEGTSPVVALRSVGAAVASSTLTTAAGFAALMAASHNGLKSMGIVACIGLITTLVVSFTVLAAVMQVMWDRLPRKVQDGVAHTPPASPSSKDKSEAA